MKKTIFCIVLTLILGLNVFAGEKNSQEEITKSYEKISGEVLSADSKSARIEDNEGQKYILHLENTRFVDLKTSSLVKKMNLKKGDLVDVYYKNDTPILLSEPPQISPNFIVKHNAKEKYEFAVDIDFYDKSGRGMSQRLILNLEGIKVLDLQGKEVPLKEKENEFLVFYKTATRSDPPQTSPEKVIDLSENLINLRKFFEDKGFTVRWQAKKYSVELEKDSKKAEIFIKDKKIIFKDKEESLNSIVINKNKSLINKSEAEKIIDQLK